MEFGNFKIDKKYIDYIIYAILGIVFIYSLSLIFSSDTEEQEVVVNPTTSEQLVLDTSSLTVKVGEETTISAHVDNNPSAVITYLSINGDIATVVGTTVKGVGVGRTYIMVRYRDSSGIDQTKYCPIDVLTNENYTVEKITMADGDIIVKLGDSYKLDYQVTPNTTNYKATYLSTDNTIASVDTNGNVKGLKEGVVAIRIKVNDATLDKTVYVTNKDIVSGLATLPTSITFKTNSIKIKLDDETNIPYSYQPETADLAKYSIWSSSDSSVVSVTDGKIKGLKEGVSTITLETVNGMKISTKVTVSPKEIKATGINITSNTSLSLNIGDVSDITYELTPSDTTDKISFSTSNSSVASVDKNGKITALSAGSATVTVKAGRVSKKINVVVTSPSSGTSGGSSGSSGSSGSGSSSSGSSSGGRCKISTDPQDATYNSCFKKSHHLTVSQSSVTVKVGSSVSIKVGLPSECGTFIKYTRTTADGSSGWGQYIGQSRTNITSSGFTWIITGRKKGSTIASQTVQYDAKSPSGKCSGNVKSMITVRVTVN